MADDPKTTGRCPRCNAATGQRRPGGCSYCIRPPATPPAAEGKWSLVACTATILSEIENKLPQSEVAKTYAMAMLSESRKADAPGWLTINRAIIDRWSMSGLDRIKRKAWKLAEVWA